MVDMQSAAISGCLNDNCTRMGFFGEDELWAPWETLTNYFGYQPWLFSLVGSAMVGLSGIFPLYIIPIDEAADLKNGESAKTLQILLSFAVGGLLGDVFLHLLPEAWSNHAEKNSSTGNSLSHASHYCGLWVLCGFLVFVIAEKMFCSTNDDDKEGAGDRHLAEAGKSLAHENNNCKGSSKTDGLKGPKLNGFAKLNGAKLNGFSDRVNGFGKLANGISHTNGCVNGFAKSNGVKTPGINGYCELRDSTKIDGDEVEKKDDEIERTRERPKQISGYLNLMANCVDNFTHGLAVGGSFLVSFRLGALTTFAILVHEIPHEIGDFAILLKSGFSRWDAAKAQLMTATGGMFGAFIAVLFSGDAVESKTSWILPFTAGGFLHIGLVNVLPELAKETNPRESLKQIGALLTGIVVMAFLTMICE